MKILYSLLITMSAFAYSQEEYKYEPEVNKAEYYIGVFNKGKDVEDLADWYDKFADWAEDLDDTRGTYLSESDLCNNIDWVKTTTTFREGKAPTVEDQEKINSNFYRWVCENAPSVAAEFHEVMRDADRSI